MVTGEGVVINDPQYHRTESGPWGKPEPESGVLVFWTALRINSKKHLPTPLT